MKIKIRWEVEDGYVGKSRPQKTVFNTNDYMNDEDWEDLDQSEKEQMIEDAVQKDFCQKITFCIEDYGL